MLYLDQETTSICLSDRVSLTDKALRGICSGFEWPCHMLSVPLLHSLLPRDPDPNMHLLLSRTYTFIHGVMIELLLLLLLTLLLTLLLI